MNYTKNHHLPQWVKDDRIMMDDFNAAMSSIESGMSANAQAAAAAKSAAASAQSTASSAQSAANRKPYVTGTYTGTGADLTINVGFKPSFVIINGMPESNDMSRMNYYGACSCATNGQGPLKTHIQFTSTGISLFTCNSRLPRLTEDGRFYEYIAFK